jgi:lipopolysaccharide export system protein LptC
VLDKNKVDVAGERMKIRQALYRGEDSKGRPFSLRARSAVQKTSREPYVDMLDLSARILMNDGPASLTAQRARYNLSKEQLGIVGPVLFQSSDGYRLETRDVGIDLKSRRMQSHAAVYGRMPIGTFSANQMQADMTARTVTLNGRANLRIDQISLKEHTR